MDCVEIQIKGGRRAAYLSAELCKQELMNHECVVLSGTSAEVQTACTASELLHNAGIAMRIKIETSVIDVEEPASYNVATNGKGNLRRNHHGRHSGSINRKGQSGPPSASTVVASEVGIGVVGTAAGSVVVGSWAYVAGARSCLGTTSDNSNAGVQHANSSAAHSAAIFVPANASLQGPAAAAICIPTNSSPHDSDTAKRRCPRIRIWLRRGENFLPAVAAAVAATSFGPARQNINPSGATVSALTSL